MKTTLTHIASKSWISVATTILLFASVFPSAIPTALAQGKKQSLAVPRMGKRSLPIAEKQQSAPPSNNRLSPVPNAPSTAAYTFATTTTGSLTNMTGSTQLIAAAQDDAASANTPIGFEFFLQGIRYTQFSATSNGFVGLSSTGGAVSSSNYSVDLGTAALPLISAMGGDLETGTAGKVHYKVTGAAPNRVLTVEFLNMGITYNNVTSDGTFQVRLHETTGQIEFVYGSMSRGPLTGAGVGNSGNLGIGFSVAAANGSLVSIVSATNTETTTTPFTQQAYPTGPIANLDSAADGSRRVYTLTPPVPTAPTGLNFTSVTPVAMTLNWTDSPDEQVYAIYRSTDGINYSFIGTVAQNVTTFTATGLNPTTNYFWNVYAVSEGALSTALSGSQATTAPGNITSNGTGGGLWSATTTWTGGVVPTATDNVTIVTGDTVIDDASAAFSLTVQNGATLQFDSATARTLTVATSVTINAGGTFQTASTGAITGHILSVGTDLTNNGTLNFSTNGNTAGANLTFTGAASNTFGGTGGTTNLRTLTINKGTSFANVLELNPTNFTVQGTVVDGAPMAFLTLTNGTLKISGTYTMTSRVFTSATYSIGATGGFWLNNPNFTVAAQTGNASVTGLFRLSQGIFNVGTATGNALGFANNSTIVVGGGSLTASGRFGVTAAGNTVNYTQTGGTITVCTVGNAVANLGNFDLGTSASSVLNMSGGTIINRLHATGTGTIDYRADCGNAGSGGITPGTTLQMGDSGSGAAKAFSLRGVFGNLVIDNTSAGHSLTLSDTLANWRHVAIGNVTINIGTTFNLGGTATNFITFFNQNVINNGTLNASNANMRTYFGGTIPQTYSGTGVVTAPCTSIEVDNTTGFTVSSTNQLITARVILFSGTVTGSNKITLGNGGASAAVVQIGDPGPPATAAGIFDVPMTFNLGTPGEVVTYGYVTADRSTGGEINPTRILSSVTFDTGGPNLTIAGGDLTVTGATAFGVAATDTVPNGRVITGANTLNIGSAGTVTRVGGLGHVDGNLKKTFAAAASKTFELGTANGYSPVVVNATAGTFPAVFTAKATQGQQPNISGANALQRYWTFTATGLTADLTFNYLAGDVVGTEANYKIFKYDGSFTQFTPTTLNTATHVATLTGVSSFSDWTLAEPAAVQPGTLQFSSPTYSVSESGPSISIDVTRTGGSDGAVGVSYTTNDGTAVAPGDYTTTTNTLSWATGDSANKTIVIPITDDSVFESSEDFTVSLSAPTGGATIGANNPATVTITDNDPAPTFAIDDVTQNEGNAGTTSFTFTVSKTGSTALSSSVDFATMDGTATAPGDYLANSGTLTFGPADATMQITVQVNGDTTVEPNETFTVQLSNPNGATIADNSGTGTITNDDVASSNADLSNLTASAGPLVPAFDPNTLSYTVNVPFSTTSTTVTPTAADAGATITVNGNPVASGSPSGPIALNVGNNTITIVVTAADTTTTKTYTINVIRGAQVVVAGSTGADGSYATLKAAFDALNLQPAQGGNTITVTINGDTTETATAALNQPATSSWTSLTVSPSGARTVSGSLAAPLIDLAGADNVTINGLNTGGNALTLSNTSTAATAGTSTIRFINGATSDTVQNCTILGSSTASTTTAGGNVLFSTSTVAGGNSSNTITANNIGPAGANLPTKGVMGLGSASPNANSSNVIGNNNIFDFFNPTISVSGINVQANNTLWTISNNRLYQTAPRVFTGTALRYAGITLNFLDTTSVVGGAFTVTGNTIGFGAANGTGTTTISGSTNEFRGIDAQNVDVTDVTSIQNNTISGINQTTARAQTLASQATVSSAGFIAIQLGGGGGFGAGFFTVGDVTANKIGSLDASSSIVINATSTTNNTLRETGILDFSQSDDVIANNEMGTITINSGGTGTRVGFGGIQIISFPGQNVTVNNNIIGGTAPGSITDNIVGQYLMHGIDQPFVFTGGSGNISCTGNIIRNMVSNSNVAGQITMRGIVLAGSVTPGVNTVSQNTIHSLSNIVTGGGLTAIYAMDLSFPDTANVVERNFIHSCSITTTATTAQVRGILVRGTVSPAAASRATYKNNMIRLGIDATGASITTPYEIIGIVDSVNTAGQNSNYYFNSIYIGGSGVASPGSSTFAFASSSTTTARIYEDNIFWNARSNAVAGGTAHYAISLAGTAPNPPGTTSNFNDLFASGTDGNVGRYNSVNQLTLANWQAATGLDANSISANPQFVNPTGTAATVNLHITCASPADSAGTPIAGVTNDFDNDTRNATTPDIGADEINLAPPTPVSAVSRKMQGAGSYDINLPFAGPAGIECRSGGGTNDYQVVFTFASPVNVGGATVSSGTGSVASTSGNGTNTITVNLTGVTNIQYITVKLTCVDDGVNLGTVQVTMGVLIGDTTANGAVNSGDVSQVKSESGNPISTGNFREDVTASGDINASDVSLVKAQSGTALP